MRLYRQAYAGSLCRAAIKAPLVRRGDYSPSRRFGFWKNLKELRRLLLQIGFSGTVVLSAVIISVRSHYESQAASMDITGYDVLVERNEIYDAEGMLMRTLPKVDGGTTRKCIPISEVASSLVDALLVMEDGEFFQHGGINWRGVRRAAWHDLTSLSLSQGGSSITQQSIKLWLERGKESTWEKLDRKALEMMLASRIERIHTKDEILANYLNRLDFGAGLDGVYAASEGFFAKHPKDLTVLEAATLVALVRSADYYSPLKHPLRCIKRRNLVLRRMQECGKLDELDAKILADQPLMLRLEDWKKKQVPDAITNLALAELKRVLPEERIRQGGLKVTLTIDWEWQKKASEAAETHLRSIQARRGVNARPIQTAIVSLDNSSGAIRMLIPGRPSVGGQLNRVTQSTLTQGSTSKPFSYLAAFKAGAKPTDMVSTAPLRPGEMSIGPSWYSPRNVGNPPEWVTLEAALAESVNTSACRAGERAGFSNVVAVYQNLDLCRADQIPRSPTAYLGAFGVTPLNLAAAYTIFPNEGPKCGKPHVVAKVTDQNGAVLHTGGTGKRTGEDPKACQMVLQCLKTGRKSGTARRLTTMRAPEDALGKTGTTDDCKDLWFAGFTKKHSTVVWIGCDKPQKVLNAYAGEVVLPLWTKLSVP